MSKARDMVIAGGGLNGCAMAIALASGGFRVTLVDPLAATTRSDDNFSGRGYALSLSSQRLLKALGIWADVAADAQPILDIKITDGKVGAPPSPFVLEFSHSEIEEGPMGFMLEDRFLRRALLKALTENDRIEILEGVAVEGHAAGEARVTVILSDGQALEAGVLVGCDGKASATAKRAGINRQGWRYGQTALVCTIAHERPHDGTAHQYFMPSGPLAILPLPGNYSSIVWTETDEIAAQIAAMSDADYLETLRPRFGDFLGDISLAGARFSYPLSLSLAERFVGERVALVGDAAHAVHPIAGQGLNAGLKDVAALAEVLVEAKRRGEDPGRKDVLERYQQWRRFDTMTLAVATDSVNRLFSNDNPITRLGRDLGLGIVNNLPGLRRSFIREAAGLTGTLPRLNQGRPL